MGRATRYPTATEPVGGNHRRTWRDDPDAFEYYVQAFEGVGRDPAIPDIHATSGDLWAASRAAYASDTYYGDEWETGHVRPSRRAIPTRAWEF